MRRENGVSRLGGDQILRSEQKLAAGAVFPFIHRTNELSRIDQPLRALHCTVQAYRHWSEASKLANHVKSHTFPCDHWAQWPNCMVNQH